MSGGGIELYVIKDMDHVLPRDNLSRQVTQVGPNFDYQDTMWQFVSTHQTEGFVHELTCWLSQFLNYTNHTS